MKNLLLIIALIASTSLLSQTTLVINDLMYSEGIESEWTVLYIPHYPEIQDERLEEGNGWVLDRIGDYRTFRLKTTKPGLYQVSQQIDGKIVQISSVKI